MTPFSTFSRNETFFFKVSSKAYTGEKMVLCSTKEASKSNSKRAAFSVLFAVGGEMCRHKNTIGSLLGLPNFISVRASLSLPAKVSLLSQENINIHPLTLPLNGQTENKVTWIQSPFLELATALKVYFIASFLVLLFMNLICFLTQMVFVFSLNLSQILLLQDKLFKSKLSWILNIWLIAIFDKMLRNI